MSRRYYPNIIITGTPTCGKTSHSDALVERLDDNFEGKFKHFSISDIAKEENFIESFDEERDTSVVDEDKLLDFIEPHLENGGIVIDWHCCEIFPERLIDFVVVLRTDNKLLYQRLSKRGYKDNKIQENLDCEIMEVIVQEARDSYAKEIVVELGSNSADELDDNVERIAEWVKNWVSDHKNGVSNELERSESSDDE